MPSNSSHVVARWLQCRSQLQVHTCEAGTMAGLSPADSPSRPPHRALREIQPTILSLPDLAWHLIFDALPERAQTEFDEPGGLLGTAGSNAFDGAALAETCTQLNAFYRLSYVSCLSVFRAISTADISRALLRFPRVRSIHLKEIATRWETGALCVDRRRALNVLELVVQNEDANAGVSRCALPVFPCLRVLRLVKCQPIGDSELCNVSQALVATLEELDLEGTELSDGARGWAAFSKLGRLKKLNLSRWGCAPIPSRAIVAIAMLTTLEEICIMGDSSLTDLHLSQLLPPLTSLRQIDFSCCKSLSPFWTYVPPSLRVFRADCTGALSDSCSKNSLSELPQLVELSVGMSQLLTTWWPLSKAFETRLEILDLSESFISGIGAADVLTRLVSLKKLILDQCNLVDDGVALAASSLPELEQLNLCGTAITMTGVRAIAHGRSATCLKYIDCCCCDELEDKDAAIDVLLKGLRHPGVVVEVW